MRSVSKIVLGNWKMNTSIHQIKEYFFQLLNETIPANHCEVGLAVPFPYLYLVGQELERLGFLLGAQDVSQFMDYGAYTGEVNMEMLKDFNTQFALVGHSERRFYFREDNILLAQKVKALLAVNIMPVFCLGETEEDRAKGLTQQVLSHQLTALSGIELTDIIIAYEPVWAIGTGEIPTLIEIQNNLEYIGTQVLSIHPEIGRIPLLYGGSVSVDNVSDIASVACVDGLLLGGASLNPIDFAKIIQLVSE